MKVKSICFTFLFYYINKRNSLLTINFSDKKLLVTIITNLDTNLRIKKSLVTKIVTIMNKKIIIDL